MDPIGALNFQLERPAYLADVMYASDRLFVNIAGIGFDGSVAAAFNTGGKRGLLNYIRLIVSGYFKSKEFTCKLSGPDFNYDGPAFIVAFANGSQYGNNARIASGAREDDGKMEVVIVRKPALWQVLRFTWQVMTGRIRNSGLVTFHRATALNAEISRPVDLHLDGEAAGQVMTLDLRVEPGKLKLARTTIRGTETP